MEKGEINQATPWENSHSLFSSHRRQVSKRIDLKILVDETELI